MKTNKPEQIDFNVALEAPKTIGDMFPFKDKVMNAKDKSLVVYKIKCSQSERTLCHRIKEHQKNLNSVCFQHMTNNPGHQMDYDNIEVIDKESNGNTPRAKTCD
jgi:hypothetical protein